MLNHESVNRRKIAKSAQNGFLKIDANPLNIGEAGEFSVWIVVLNVDGSSPSGHPSKVLIIKRLQHFYFDLMKAD
jgi:hypothetical protein